MNKKLIILCGLLIAFPISNMFKPWFDYKKSIENTKNLQAKALCLLNKNQQNKHLKDYLKSLDNKEIDTSNYAQISRHLKTLLFPLNTNLSERFINAPLPYTSSSWFNPLSWNLFGNIQQRSIAVIQEIPEIVADTSTSLQFPDGIIAAGGVVVADSFVRQNNNSSTFTLLLTPLYFIIPLVAVCLKKCTFDMNPILRHNNQYLREHNKQNANLTLQLTNQNNDLHQDISRLTILTNQQIEQAAQAQVAREQLEKNVAELNAQLDQQQKDFRKRILKKLLENKLDKSKLVESNKLVTDLQNELMRQNEKPYNSRKFDTSTLNTSQNIVDNLFKPKNNQELGQNSIQYQFFGSVTSQILFKNNTDNNIDIDVDPYPSNSLNNGYNVQNRLFLNNKFNLKSNSNINLPRIKLDQSHEKIENTGTDVQNLVISGARFLTPFIVKGITGL